MAAVTDNLQAVHARIAAASQAVGRSAVRLLAVSKGQPASAVREAYAAGQRAFGENYVQEALEKMRLLEDLAIEWHFIGPIQSNKTSAIARHFAWVHSIDRPKTAERLSHSRPTEGEALQVCIQVNISQEGTKGGVAPGDAQALAQTVFALPGLRLRGLMAIPAPACAGAAPHAPFQRMRRLLEELNNQGLTLDTLSMGMSDDLEVAIAHGATIVRVGTAIFGARSA
jgi:PLP dependent protein